MKILQVNKFLYPKGGDAIVMLGTGKLLESRGYKVSYWGMSHEENPDFVNKEYLLPFVDYGDKGGPLLYCKRAKDILYNYSAKALLGKKIQKEKPDIAHLHNFAHQISPSILHVFKKYNIPLVMTMHDYKLVCASYMLLSKGKICEKCKGRRYYQCFLEKCVKNSRPKSLLNTIEMYAHHKVMHIYDLVDVFISPSKFLKDKVGEMGFKGKIVHLPNFINLDEYKPQYESSEKSIVYFGRLSQEKGLFTLLEAVKGIPDVMLKIVGEGPIKEALADKVKGSGIKNIQFLGYKKGEELKNEIRKSMFVVLPSEWYENNPRSIIEGFALGKPAIGARIGGIPELVKDKETGHIFESGNSEDLRAKIKSLADNPNKIIEMGKNARRFVEENLNSRIHYKRLNEIYSSLMNKK